jgi:hypothetical protein
MSTMELVELMQEELAIISMSWRSEPVQMTMIDTPLFIVWETQLPEGEYNRESLIIRKTPRIVDGF